MNKPPAGYCGTLWRGAKREALKGASLWWVA